MKTQLRKVVEPTARYEALAFVCPGCRELTRGSGLHMLPVNTPHKNPSWDFDGDLWYPTLEPSILTKSHFGVCHSFLKGGFFEYLADCTHSLAGQRVAMVDLPTWFTKEEV